MDRNELIADAKRARELGDTELELAILKKVDAIPEHNPVSSFLSGTGSSVLNMGANAADLFGKGETLHQWASEGSQNAQGAAGSIGKAFGGAVPYFALSGGLAAQSVGTGLLDALTSPGSIEDRIKQGIISGGSNALLGKTLQEVGGLFSNKFSASKEAAQLKNVNKINPSLALKNAQKEGYVVSPSDVNPSIFNGIMESISGKAATIQEAQKRNADISTLLTRKELLNSVPDPNSIGLSIKTPMSMEFTKKAREANWKPYQDIAALPHPEAPPRPKSNPFALKPPKQEYAYPSEKALEDLKDAWTKKRKLEKSLSAQYDSVKERELSSVKDSIKGLEELFQNRATESGNDELVKNLLAARTNIAKTYTVEDAINKVTGLADSRYYGKLIDKKKPLTGDIRKAGEFEQAFPRVNRDPEHVPPANVNQLMHYLAPSVGAVGGGMLGGLPGAIVGFTAAELGPEIARKIILSGPYQRRFAQVAMDNPSTILGILDKLTNNELSRRAVPYISQIPGNYVQSRP